MNQIDAHHPNLEKVLTKLLDSRFMPGVQETPIWSPSSRKPGPYKLRSYHMPRAREAHHPICVFFLAGEVFSAYGGTKHSEFSKS